MKKVFLLLCFVCLIFVIGLVSCEGNIFPFPDDIIEPEYPSNINVYALDSSKSLSGLEMISFPVNKEVTENDFRRMEKEFFGKTILGLEFVNVVRISGQFVTSGTDSSLTDLIFPTSLVSIEEHVFETSYNLTSIVFNGEGAPSVDTTAFPASFASDCYFTVPVASKEAYKATGCLEPWINASKNGYMNVMVTLKLNVQNTSLFDKVGNPVLTTPTYTVITCKSAPTELCTPTNPGWTFEGWFTDSDAVATSFTDAQGNVVSYEVTSYTDSNGNWINEGDENGEVNLYAAWTEHSYTLKFDKNYTSATGSTSDTKLMYSDKYTLTDKSEAFTRKGYHIVKWKTTETDETSSTEYEVGQTVSGLVAEDGGEITLYAIWEPKDNLTYTIQYYLQDTTGITSTDHYIFDDSLTDASHTGKVDTTATAIDEGITGFTYNASLSTPSDLIAGDESTVLYMYYDRNKYDVTWDFDNGGETSTTSVLFGVTPSFSGTPEKGDTAEWDYEFDKWDPDLGPVEGDTKYTAQYGSVKQKYTVYIVTSPSDESWGTVDVASVTGVTYGTVLKTSGTQLVVEQKDSQGETVESTVVVTPSPASTTTDYTYVLGSWDKEGVTITTNTTVTALFERYDNQQMEQIIQSDCTLDIYYSYTFDGEKQYKGASPEYDLGISVAYGSSGIDLSGGSTLAGYHLVGFYAESSCDTLVMDESGTFVSSATGFTDSDGKWACTALDRAVVLYAKWELND